MLQRLQRAPWRGVPRSRSTWDVRGLAGSADRRWKPLAQTLVDAARTSLTAQQARALCAALVHDTHLASERRAPLTADSTHACLLQAVLRMRSGSVRRDVLVSELLLAIWATDTALPAELLMQLADACRVRGLQRTRALLHRHLLTHTCEAHVWRALLDAHAARRDWPRVEQGLAACAAQGRRLPLEAYRYALQRLQHESPNQLPAALHRVLQQMQADAQLLDDTLLAELVHALGAPVRHAQASRVRTAELVRIAAPVHALLDSVFEWVWARNHHVQYRNALGTLLHTQLSTVEALHRARVYGVHALRVPQRHTSPIRQRLEKLRPALQGPDGLVESVQIRLDGASGDMDLAVARLTAWLQTMPSSPIQAKRQRATLRALVAAACRQPLARQLAALVQLLHVATVHGATAQLWHGFAGQGLPRLWAHLVRVWADQARTRPHRIALASTPQGWPLLAQALPMLLQAIAHTRHLPHRAWRAVLEHPRRVRAMVWAACCAAPHERAPARMRELEHLFHVAHSRPRVARWARAARREAEESRGPPRPPSAAPP